jgi:hypothetical protein
MPSLLKLVSIAWTSPNTVLGLLFGLAGLCSGGRVQIRCGCLEFHGGFVSWLIRHMLLGHATLALTLGHTILGQSASALEIARDHEHIHVRQYEIWGPFFLFAYLGSSAWLWLIGKDAYHDNPFEIEAYSRDAHRDEGQEGNC